MHAILDSSLDSAHLVTNGVKAILPLVKVALGNTGQSQYVRRFLLGLFNSRSWPFDLLSLRCLDSDLQKACISLLTLNVLDKSRDMRDYFADGTAMYHQLMDLEEEINSSKYSEGDE